MAHIQEPVRKLVKRAGNVRTLPIPLEETLKYALMLATMPADITTTPHSRARYMGVEVRAMQRRETHPDFELVQQMVEKLDTARSKEKTFGNYVFKHLTPESKATWQELQFWAEHKDRQEHVERIMNGKATKVRQELFVHALVSTHFDMSRALSMTGLSKPVLDHWLFNDLQFSQLVEEIQWHKKNFFEKALMDLVGERNPLAVIWVNKTANADRGYSEKIRVEHTLAQNNGGFSFEDLDLDLETRKKVLEAIRKKREQGEAVGNGNGHVKALPPARNVNGSEAEIEAEILD